MVNRTQWRCGFLLVVGVVLLNGSFRTTGQPSEPALPSVSGVSRFDTVPTPVRFGLGRAATTANIARLDIDVRPDGKGLPAGVGTAMRGKTIFATKCAVCHGAGGVGGTNGSLVTTVVSSSAVANKRPEKTIGNYWPYATTVFDYIRRAMPFSEPGSLTNEEVYNLTAYLLHANGIINEQAVMTAHTLPKVVMPAQKLFILDDRRGGPEIR
jgi:cytochrome c